MRTAGALGMAVAALAGCATPGGATREVAATATIRYETAPCFGTCPVYAVTVHPDGSGTFEGMRFTAVSGTRTFAAGADAYRRFAATLAPLRPAHGERLIQPGAPDCGNAPTDMPSVDVHWTEAGGTVQHLHYYYGCRDEAARAALRTAPDMLPIARFIRADDGPR